MPLKHFPVRTQIFFFAVHVYIRNIIFKSQFLKFYFVFSGYTIDSLLETTTTKEGGLSVPIPLPVYIRTRSPSTSETFGKAKKCRRSRTVFTDLQLMALEKRFETQKYLSTPDRIEVAEALGLTQLQVKTWYQNRRMKWKKQVHARMSLTQNIRKLCCAKSHFVHLYSSTV